MQYQEDWLMRQIAIIASMLRGIAAGRSANKNSFDEFEQTNALSNMLYTRLLGLLAQGRLCDAENLLFESMGEEDVLETAILFYEKVNEFSDEELANHNFSRAEIMSGLHEVCKRYEISDDAFFEIANKLKEEENK